MLVAWTVVLCLECGLTQFRNGSNLSPAALRTRSSSTFQPETRQPQSSGALGFRTSLIIALNTITWLTKREPASAGRYCRVP
jgi:hypothetical protein